MPFPRILRWALLGPFAAFVAAYLLALLGKDATGDKLFGEVLIVTTFAVALVEVVAVPVAIFLLVRGGYVTVANIATTLAAAIPLGIILFVLWVFKYGHFHI